MPRKQIVLLYALWPVLLCASNQHEHFYGFVNTESILSAYTSIYGKDVGEKTLGFVSGKDGRDRSLKLVTSLFGTDGLERMAKASGLKVGDPGFGPWLSGLSMNQASKILGESYGVTPKSIFNQFFEYGPQSRKDIPNYKFNEDIRKAIFKSLIKEDPGKYRRFLKATFADTLDSIPLKDRTTVALSIPGDLFDRESQLMLRDLFRSKGSRAEFHYSYPRYKILEDQKEFDAKLDQIRQGLREGWAHGVDVTGSIEEKAEFDNTGEKASEFRRRIEAVGRVVAEGKGLLKFHAFEKERTGAFYDGFWSYLTDLGEGKIPKPPMIVVAHIAQLQETDMERLERLQEKGVHLGFDANIPSNLNLQGSTEKDLVQKLERLTQAGFSVGLGGDGRGIIGGHELSALFDLVERQLPPNRAKALQAKLLAGSLAMRGETLGTQKSGLCDPSYQLLSGVAGL